MHYALFNGSLERLNANCFPLSFDLDQADGEFLFEPLLVIRGDATKLTLQLVSDALQISQAPGHDFCLSEGSADLKLQSLVGGHGYHHICCVFDSSFPYGKLFGEYASGNVPTSCNSCRSRCWNDLLKSLRSTGVT